MPPPVQLLPGRRAGSAGNWREYYRNTGYGLFLSEEILNITGASIRETGTEGEGFRFEIRFPKGMYRFSEGR